MLRTRLLALIVGLAPAGLLAATYYVKPDGSGNNANPGTLAAPWRTLQYAQDNVVAGDTVLLIGAPQSGPFNTFAIAASDANYNYVHKLSTSGITYAPYGNSTGKPVFDFSSVGTSLRVCGFLISGSNITIEGLEIKGVKVGTQKQSECFRVTGNNNTFRELSIHDNEANGLYTTGAASGIRVENCDSYNNIGLSNSAGNTDGFGSHAGSTTFYGCRAWNNSDDGYDCISTTRGSVAFQYSWAYNHRLAGNKTGFKVGGFGSGNVPTTVYTHSVTHCLSALNGANGFYANHQPGKSADWTYNTAYGNSGANYDMLERVPVAAGDPIRVQDATDDIPGTLEVLHFNIAYSGTTIRNENVPAANKTNNSWTKAGVSVSSTDFQSLDHTQMTRARTATGGLPAITFMKLASGSDLAGLGY